MDPLVIGGLILSLLGIIVATIMDGNSFGPLIGPSSAVLVLVGTIGASVISFQLKELKRVPDALKVALGSSDARDLDGTVTTLGMLSGVARRDGMLALESRLEEVEDDFVREGLQLLVDGLDADQVRERLEISIAAIDERHQVPIGFFKTLGGYAPTFGMLGTVIGLINMLGNLTSPEQLGVGMSLALLTTLYGVFFANLFFLPLATRLERLNEQELSVLDVALDGILGLQAGMSPRLLVERLETYLAPDERIGYAERMQGPTDASETLREVA